MGLYYNPNPPFVGAPQPLEGRKLTPPQSGPAAQNPPFRGSRVGQETLNSWAVAVTVAAIGVILPPLLVPQPVAAAPTPYNPARYDIYRAWDAPPPTPQVAINLNPPIAGPVASNPPFSGTAWVPFPLNNDIPFDVLFRRLVIPSSAVVSNPPFMGGAYVKPEILIGWLPPAPMPIVGPKFTAGAAAPSNPPFRGGAHVPLTVLIGWLPPIPAPIVGPKFTSGSSVITATLAATESPDIASFTVTFRPLWTPQTTPSEIWTPATNISVTWTKE